MTTCLSWAPILEVLWRVALGLVLTVIALVIAVRIDEWRLNRKN